jgi:Fe2+ or Zn2+ uptake regulation protein
MYIKTVARIPDDREHMMHTFYCAKCGAEREFKIEITKKRSQEAGGLGRLGKENQVGRRNREIVGYGRASTRRGRGVI